MEQGKLKKAFTKAICGLVLVTSVAGFGAQAAYAQDYGAVQAQTQNMVAACNLNYQNSEAGLMRNPNLTPGQRQAYENYYQTNRNVCLQNAFQYAQTYGGGPVAYNGGYGYRYDGPRYEHHRFDHRDYRDGWRVTPKQAVEAVAVIGALNLLFQAGR